MVQSEKAPKTIQSVHRALEILERLAVAYSGWKLGDLAKACGLNKTTAFHLLKTLEARGYAEQSYDTQVYKLGWKAIELFAEFYQDIDIRPVAIPYMDKIRDQLDETVTCYYYVKVDDYYMASCIIQMESSQSLKFSSRLGSRAPLHCTAAGKVRWLGYDQDMLQKQLAKTPFPQYTQYTTATADDLLAQLPEIRRKGHCIEREEYMPGICSIAVPMFKYTGRVAYSISVSVPTVRADDQRLETIARVMMDVLKDATTYPDFQFKGAPIP